MHPPLKNFIRRTGALLACLALLTFIAGCSSETANLTTTAGESAATVDNSAGIGSGQTIISANTATGTSVNGAPVGLTLQLSLPATGTGTASAKFSNTLAMQWAADKSKLVAYGQTLGLAAQTILPDLVAAAGDATKVTSLFQQLTAAWGLTPVTPSQSSLYTEVENGATKAASDLSLLEGFFTGVSTTGTVATAASTSTTGDQPLRGQYLMAWSERAGSRGRSGRRGPGSGLKTAKLRSTKSAAGAPFKDVYVGTVLATTDEHVFIDAAVGSLRLSRGTLPTKYAKFQVVEIGVRPVANAERLKTVLVEPHQV